ncbi:MAG: MerR family transcriptional regulator [Candidatus Riflebacteria bacterium]|nr:MerR family transcriptional regulator [Candidatus Riflebacteria bacterium]
MKSFFTPKDVRELVDVSYRQIQYWDKSNFISPSYRRRGKYRLYTFADVLMIKIVETLRKRGYSVQQLRHTLDVLRGILKKVNFPFTELKILFEKNRMLVFNGDLVLSHESDRFIYFSAASLKKRLEELYEHEGDLEEAA